MISKRDRLANIQESTKILFDSIPEIDFDKENEPIGKYSMIKMLVESKAREIFDALVKIKREPKNINIIDDSENYDYSVDIEDIQENLNLIFKKLTAIGIDLIYSKLEGEIESFVNERINDEFQVVIEKITGVLEFVSRTSSEMRIIYDRIQRLEEKVESLIITSLKSSDDIKKLDDFVSGLRMYKTSVLNK